MFNAIDPDDVIGVVKEFNEAYAGNDTAQNVVLGMGAELLGISVDISVDTLVEKLSESEG